jgi:hypothetical protein
MIQYPKNKEHNVKTAIQVPITHETALAKVQVLHVHSFAYIQGTDICNGIRVQVSKESNLNSIPVLLIFILAL